MNQHARTKRTFLVAISGLLLLIAAVQSGCSLWEGLWEGLWGGLTPSIDKAIATIQNAVDTMAQQSAAWQSTMTKLEQDLVAQGQSTLATEVTQLAQRGIATGGTELRCDADFIGARMKEGLERILAQLKNQPIPPVNPYFCNVAPTQIDLGLDPSRRTELDLYGYNLDVKTVKVAVLDDSGEHAVASNLIAFPTHYLMTVNISEPNGLRFPPTVHQIVFRFPSGDMHTVNVVTAAPPPPAPPLPVCSWSGWGCGTLLCGPTQYLAGVEANADGEYKEGCWGVGKDTDEPTRRIKCCKLPQVAPNCYWTAWSCGEIGCPDGYHAAGIAANADQAEGCWGVGNDTDEPTRDVQCCQTPPVPFKVTGQCFWSNWGCGVMECPPNFYIGAVEANADGEYKEGCWGVGNDTDEPTRRIKCCPL